MPIGMDSAQGATIREWAKNDGAQEAIVSVLELLAGAGAGIAQVVRHAPISGLTSATQEINVQGEVQQQLDLITNDIMVGALSDHSLVAAMVSEEVEDVIQNKNAGSDARYVVCFDPLDGSSNIDTNGTIGSIFSVLELEEQSTPVQTENVLDAVHSQKAAGYLLYGPATLLMVTTGQSVAMFAYDLERGAFGLVQGNIQISQTATEFAINMAHQRFWDNAITQYVGECVEGESGPRAKRYNMRWAGSMVADVHRIFMHGGIFIYPALSSSGGANGKLRYLYEANPMEMLVKAAGGLTTTGPKPFKEIPIETLHQRIPVALGSTEEVEYLVGIYHQA